MKRKKGGGKIVWLLDKNHSTNWCKFSIDSESDLDLLPKYGVSGKGILNTISSCCPNSKAMCTNGDIYAFNGDTNEWKKYASLGGGSGGGSTVVTPDLNYATDDDIKNLFK